MRPTPEPAPELTGKIARIVADRGFCFIRGSDSRDYFAHYTEFREGLRLADLRVGDALRFLAVETPKGLRAVEIGRAAAA